MRGWKGGTSISRKEFFLRYHRKEWEEIFKEKNQYHGDTAKVKNISTFDEKVWLFFFLRY